MRASYQVVLEPVDLGAVTAIELEISNYNMTGRSFRASIFMGKCCFLRVVHTLMLARARETGE